jgi:type IV secretion system protein VirB9
MYLRPIRLILMAATLAAGGCAAKNRPADIPLPPRGRMSYDAETTVQMAVASRLEDERQALAALFAASQPTGLSTSTTRPATVEVPAPQLIPVPASIGQGNGATFDQGPSAHPVEEALAVVANANEHATRSPTPAGFLNAVHYYDYAPGVRYNAIAAAGYITTIRLRQGEELRSLSCNDTAAYEIDQVEEGTGETAATLILIKPKQANTQSNWVLTTDERTYLVDLFVNPEPNFQSMIAWHYPLDGLRVLGDRREQQRLRVEKGDVGGLNMLTGTAPAANTSTSTAAAPDAVGPTVGPLGMNLGDLNFGYVVLYQSRGRDGKTRDAEPPPWAPLRVFDDGSKTFVQFPPQARNYELPPVFALDHPDSKEAELVNYRRSGDFLVIDQLVVAAEMRAGEAPQQIVKIVRGKAADPGITNVTMDEQPRAQADPQVTPQASTTRRPLAGYLYTKED